MATRLNSDALRWLDTLNQDGTLARMSDGPLLERFLSRTGASSEVAFEVLVRRHGPMVLSLCRGVLHDDHAAADAFQATFLVLARRASTVRDRDNLAAWLGRVAKRIALSSREEAARRAARERRIAVDDAMAVAGVVDHAGFEIASLVNAEVKRLPKVERILLQLTYWQGKTYEEAAAHLSWPIGTVRSRLSRARERLRSRLTRRGLAPIVAVAGSSALTTRAASAQTHAELVVRTVRAATRYANGMTAAIESGAVPATVLALVNGELSLMAATSWKSIAVMLFVGGMATAGVGSLAVRSSDAGAGEPVMRVAASEPATPAALPAAQEKADNRLLLINGGIEEGTGDSPQAWTAGAEIAGVEYIWSRATGHTGKASLCLKKSAKRYFPIAQWFQKVDHKGDGPRLKVSAWVKADQVTKAILDAQYLDSNGQRSHAWVAYIGPKEPDKPPFTHDWKRYEGVVAIPPDTKQIIIAPQIYGPGTVWFDDLGAEYTNDPATDPIGS
jgi:RNA polymerase sigma factor (sigma-70 family)